MTQRAFVLRIAPGGIDKVPEALNDNEILIGWSDAEGLLDESLSWEPFRKIVSDAYYAEQTDMRKAGAAAGHMWRFLRDMKPGDLVVVPYGSSFYVAEIRGSARYAPSKVADDSAYRRPVEWLNGKLPIPRQVARAALLSRMKVQGTSADASDLIADITESLALASRKQTPTFQSDLRTRLVGEIVKEMRAGRMESFGFERLLQAVFLGLGAVDCKIIPRNWDKGADLVATFRVAGAFEFRVAIQAKHWQPDPPVNGDVVRQLIKGIEAEEANLGLVVTSGSFAEDAREVARTYFEDEGIRIELIDGEELAKLMVEHGIRTI
jgi:predicted Mrr-cat superfamily restriction endonuclease